MVLGIWGVQRSLRDDRLAYLRRCCAADVANCSDDLMAGQTSSHHRSVRRRLGVPIHRRTGGRRQLCCRSRRARSSSGGVIAVGARVAVVGPRNWRLLCRLDRQHVGAASLREEVAEALHQPQRPQRGGFWGGAWKLKRVQRRPRGRRSQRQ
jgi:hypothetical protein